VHHVTVTNGVPKLAVACYAQGQTQRSLLSIWRTVMVNQSVSELVVSLKAVRFVLRHLFLL